MANLTRTLRDLNLTRDEAERFTEALKDKNFRKMLIDYVEEVQSPENQKLYEKEITELERQRGVDVTFVKPNAGYVIKTSANGENKVFINICSNDIIEKPSSSPSVENEIKGKQWKIPHTLTPPRDDTDKKNKFCKVYDVVFHPDSLKLAQNNKQFKQMLNNIACEAVESNFKITLDKKNLKFPKMQYKGRPYSAVLRKQSEVPPETTEEDREFMDKLFAEAGCPYKPPSAEPQPKPIKMASNSKSKSRYTTPKYTIKHRSHIELEQFTEHKASKMNSAIPKELVVEISLPLLKSAEDIVLDVNERTLHLSSEKSAKYKLDLTLPYEVTENLGNAKFDKDNKKLIVTLPVKRNQGVVFTDSYREDSGIESDHGSLVSSSPLEETEEKHLVEELIRDCASDSERTSAQNDEETIENTFLDPHISYNLPDFTCHVFENIFAFTLHVKNVTETSLHKKLELNNEAIHLKFTSISSGFFPVHYAFYFKLQDITIDSDSITTEVWDNNVVVQIPIKCDKKVVSFFVGIDKDCLSERYVDDPSVLNKVFQENLKKQEKQTEKLTEELENDVFEPESNCAEEKPKTNSKKEKKKGKSKSKQNNLKTNLLNPVKQEITQNVSENNENSENLSSEAIDIIGQCESSGDELSCSYSPRSKGILKHLPHITRSVSRSMSESSIDENGWASGEACQSVESTIPEEEHASTSLKKTVRFNDVVSKQIFRSNSSILGQRKKNQRKAKAKKRAQERKHSESELSETEEKKEKDSTHEENSFVKESSINQNFSEKEDTCEENDIFLMDIDF